MKILTSRVGVFAVAAAAQLLWIVVAYAYLYDRVPYLSQIIFTLTVIMILWLNSSRMNPAYKLGWSILILVFPFFGIVLYVVFGQSRFFRYMNRHRKNRPEGPARTLPPADTDTASLTEGQKMLSDYLLHVTGYPVYRDEDLRYYRMGEDAIRDMLEALSSAQKYIFLEYFIIGKGSFWDEIHAVLRERVAAGVEVRVLYDDMGSAGKIPRRYDRVLCEEGIDCIRFNPIFLVNSIRANNRDHRKIMLIDGNYAFIGGFNLSDEYVNRTHPFGIWKDAGLRIRGRAVDSYVSMFLDMWSAVSGRPSEDEKYYTQHGPGEGTGYIQPYDDKPFDDVFTSQGVYLHIISHAVRTLDVMTPYLVIDNEIMTALCNAARSGVHVRIFTPGIPDKRLVYLVTQSYYGQLLDAGVEIRQYIPGFLHSKVMLADDDQAAVGSVNLDFRSLYLHYECGAVLYNSGTIRDIRADFDALTEETEDMRPVFHGKRNVFVGMLQSILRLFAPMF